MKNFPLVLLLLVCTGFIVILNLSYLRKILVHTDLRGAKGDYGPPPRTKPLDLAPKPIFNITGKDKAMAAVKSTPIATKEEARISTGGNHRVAGLNISNNDRKEKAMTAVDSIPLAPKEQAHLTSGGNHRVAGLNCDKYGGPTEDIASEMVYWRDIPSDADYISPFANYGQTEKYLTFEPDEGGWNNIRMSMETATVLAHAMGRILVLPPEQQMYLLWNDQKKNKNRFTFKDFFHFDSIAEEHSSVEVISMEEFIKREALTGHLKEFRTGKVTFPPDNATTWDGNLNRGGRKYWEWLRNATVAPIWNFDQCMAVFASEPGREGADRVLALRNIILEKGNRIMDYVDNPTPVDAPPEERLKEQIGTRKDLCVYGDMLQNQKVIHFMGDNKSGARLLVHFYAFMFFEDHHQDLWVKRFVRDHLRYIDEIQCAAARVVDAVRKKSRENGDPTGTYDSFHIRRGDFQYKQTRISAEEIYENTKELLVENSTIFIATDEKDETFFEPLRKHYNLLFLKDFMHLVEDLNSNYMGMLDQRIASRGRTFIGAYYSTFTGYINRMRGYHSQKDKLLGYDKGEISSYFYVPLANKFEMSHYWGIKNPMWGREFPVGWRDIDHDLPPEAFRNWASTEKL